MFVVTNRQLNESRTGLAQFNGRLSALGPNELRMAEVTRAGDAWKVGIVPDELDDDWLRRGGIDDAWRRRMGFSRSTTLPGSAYVAAQLLERINPASAPPCRRGRDAGRNLLVFVHGYNNDMPAVVERAARLERDFNVEALTFSWPAHGGGVVGALSYKADKRDARASVGALDRMLARIGEYLSRFTAGLTLHRDDARSAEARDAAVTRLTRRRCPFTVNLMLHSMGAYVYKHVLLSSASEGAGLIFDKVVLLAADVNHADHAAWVDRILARRRVYVTINEDDAALALSRLKTGSEQRARLGHQVRGPRSSTAVYVDFTGAAHVEDSHSYFEGAPLRNPAVHRFFDAAFNGRRAEDDLRYDPATGMYRGGSGEAPRRAMSCA